jgi:hypothetical protein
LMADWMRTATTCFAASAKAELREQADQICCIRIFPVTAQTRAEGASPYLG